MKESIKDWDPMCARIVSKTPEEMLVDWKLVYRDPLPTWVSPKARILLLGDSAHPFLPTSAQGYAILGVIFFLFWKSFWSTRPPFWAKIMSRSF